MSYTNEAKAAQLGVPPQLIREHTAVSPEVAGENTANTLQELLGAQLRPVPVSPGLMVYLDQVKRARLIAHWNEVLRTQ